MANETWCDKLASTPAIGFQYDNPHYIGSDSLLTSMSTILDNWTSATKSDFSIANQDSFGLNIQRENGFLYQFDPFKCSVTFQHRMKLRPTSGGLPIAEFASEPLPFTRSLDIASEELVEVALLLSEKNKARSIKRIGIVSTTVVAETEVPPGVKKFIDYASRPWSGELEGYNFTVIAKLRETDVYSTRCIHSIAKSEDPDQLMTLNFDWQKVYSKPIPLIREAVEKEVASIKNSALEYLERLAEGNVFDEHVI